jgi:hypothetical protein
VAHAWAESSAHGSGDEEVMKPTILLTLLLTLTASAFEFTGKVVSVAVGLLAKDCTKPFTPEKYL